MSPSVSFHGQPFGKARPAGSVLRAMLDDDEISTIAIVVAWVRFRGLLRLKPSFEAFRERGGRLRVVLGVDEGGATRPGLLGVMRLANEAYVFKDACGGTFHPKVYLGEGAHKAELLVGSTNLTPGGLYVNVEASMLTGFALPAEDKHPALGDARLYIAGLIGDREACTRLTRKTVDKLCAEARYRIALNERPRSRGRGRPRGAEPGDIDETAAGATGEVTRPLFSPSRRRRTRIPALTQADKDELAALELDDPREPGQAVAAGAPESGAGANAVAQSGVPVSSAALVPAGAPSPAGTRAAAGSRSATPSPPRTRSLAPNVTDVWTKKLKRSDAQQVSARSNPTGLLRLTKEDHDIDHLTWFRGTLFRAPVIWAPQHDRRGNPIEVAVVSFDVRVGRARRRRFALKVDHAPHRESGQGNVPTLIHWGPELGAMLRAHDYTGHLLTLERLEGGSYRLTIA
jgi:hypothetical protein